METTIKEKIIKYLGFRNLRECKEYLKANAKLNEWGSVFYSEFRNGIELQYSDNCKYKYSIGFNNKGIFETIDFN